MSAIKIAIGNSDFKSLRQQGSYYVDKSLLIRDILEKSTQISLFPRPRRFGKTLNLSMLRYFFEKTEESHRDLFSGLAIEQYPEAMEHQGQYPVIFLTFKDIKQSSWEQAHSKIQTLVAQLYSSQRHLLTSDQVTPQEKKRFEQILNEESTQEVLEGAVQLLMELLHRITGKKVIVLIDEYDVPIDAAFHHDYYDSMIQFMRNFLSAAFKDNLHIEKGVITGVLRIAKESMFSGLNNMKVYHLMHLDFATAFGFTQPEVDSMLKTFAMEHETNAVQRWYNGYLFGGNVIYNPWSLLNYLEQPKAGFRPYWIHTGSMELIRELIVSGSSELHAALHQLMEGKTIHSAIHESIVFRDLKHHPLTVMSLLLFSGYLKPVASTKQGLQDIYELAVPNQEVQLFYEQVIQSWLEITIGSSCLNAVLRALQQGDAESFEYVLQDLVTAFLSYHDTTVDAPEKVYHAFVLGLLVHLQDAYLIESNHESGYGRYDVALSPKNSQHPGIILEFKKIITQKEKSAKVAMKNAFLQIQEKQYASELRKRGIENIVAMGVVIDKQKVWVESMTL